MREIRMSGSMSGEWKKELGYKNLATAPLLDSTNLTHDYKSN